MGGVHGGERGFWREGRGNRGLAEYVGEKGGCIADKNGVAVRQKGKVRGKYGQYDNDYSWRFKFKEGEILSIEEFNSDFLVVKSLYGKVLRNKN